jgi:hypothetical protein
VKGIQILGEYPDDLTGTGPLNIGRGRLIPTTSWEAIGMRLRVGLESPMNACQMCYQILRTFPPIRFSTRTTCSCSSS